MNQCNCKACQEFHKKIMARSSSFGENFLNRTKEQMLSVAKGATLMQNFKLAVWKRMTNHDGSVKKEFDYIPEKTLDELAMIALRLNGDNPKT